MAQVNLNAFGYNESTAVTAATKTLAEGDSGVVQDVSVSSVITLPATAVGTTYLVRVASNGITVAVSPAAADKIMGNGFTSADNKDLIFTNQPAGSFVELRADGADGYFVSRISGTATREA